MIVVGINSINIMYIMSVAQVTNFINEFDRRPMSKKGYTLGARTAIRFREYIDVCIVARDSIYAKRAYAIAIPSVRLSVCLSVTRVIHAKTVVVRIVQFSLYSSPIPLVFVR